MLIAIDAHAIGRHLTGNEVYVRSLLNAFAAQNQDREILAYVSGAAACASIPDRIRIRRVAANPFLRLGFDLASRVRKDRPGSASRAIYRAGGMLGTGSGHGARRQLSGASRSILRAAGRGSCGSRWGARCGGRPGS